MHAPLDPGGHWRRRCTMQDPTYNISAQRLPSPHPPAYLPSLLPLQLCHVYTLHMYPYPYCHCPLQQQPLTTRRNVHTHHRIPSPPLSISAKRAAVSPFLAAMLQNASISSHPKNGILLFFVVNCFAFQSDICSHPDSARCTIPSPPPSFLNELLLDMYGETYYLMHGSFFSRQKACCNVGEEVEGGIG